MVFKCRNYNCFYGAKISFILTKSNDNHVELIFTHTLKINVKFILNPKNAATPNVK